MASNQRKAAVWIAYSQKVVLRPLESNMAKVDSLRVRQALHIKPVLTTESDEGGESLVCIGLVF